jgi:hypothetical protein
MKATYFASLGRLSLVEDSSARVHQFMYFLDPPKMDLKESQYVRVYVHDFHFESCGELCGVTILNLDFEELATGPTIEKAFHKLGYRML